MKQNLMKKYMLPSDVSLRALEPEDLELLYSIENDSYLWQFTSATAQPWSRYALKQYLAQQPADIYQLGEMRLVVEYNGEAVGLTDLTQFSPRHKRAQVSIALLRSHCGHGIGSQALQRLHSYAVEQLHIQQLYALVMRQSNPVSFQLFSHSGYEHIATLPKWHFDGTNFQDVEFMQRLFPVL